MKNKSQTKYRIAILSPYVPRKCGIATYSENLYKSLNRIKGVDTEIGVLCSNSSNKKLPKEVKKTINPELPSDYCNYAQYVNCSDIDLVHIQHEFGLYGGVDGSFIENFVEEIMKPFVITFHTVLLNPSDSQASIVNYLCRRAKRVIVMAKSAKERLILKYNVSSEKIMVIPHGVPEMLFSEDNSSHKKQMGFNNQKILSTFGLLSRNKGLEYVIDSLPNVLKKFPNALFLIIGKTHPNVVKADGEEYRKSLMVLARMRGVKENVVFVNRYLTKSEISKYFLISDIYITPYLEKQQITSGTLAYALGAGKPIVSTKYDYARELITPSRGELVSFKSSDGIADAIIKLLSNEKRLKRIAISNYKFSRHMLWSEVGIAHSREYSEIINQLINYNLSYDTKIQKKMIQTL